ncbi:hypothetical protein KR018_007015 [Drosophila ironensis]|nr:hypothetical protein KR018_007015 [Drosophila ironensis]
MLRKSKKQPQTVADKVNKLIAHPNESDTEEDSDFDAATGPRLEDFAEGDYDLPDARSTSFRKQNVKLLSEESSRYKGKISSRRELEMEDDEDEESDDDEEEDEEEEEEELAYEESDEEDEDALAAFNQKLKSRRGQDKAKKDEEDSEAEAEDSEAEDEDSGPEEHDDDDDNDDDDDDDDDDYSSEEEGEDSEGNVIKAGDVMSKTNQQAEIQKGLCVQNQLRIWERLLELRINTQKFTSKANQLPSPETLKTLGSESQELESVLQEAQERSSKLLQQLMALQTALHNQNSEMRKAVKRKQPSAEDAATPTKRFGGVLESNFQQMSGYRNKVLLKWDDRTKLLTPGAVVKRKSGVQEDFDIIKKIDSALANREALVEKSQTPKGNQTEAPKEQHPEQQENAAPQRVTHIYDDSDFYHQQLRELIEYKASTSSNMSEITKQFVELQKLRQKMKKKVDTRASKGRKLRYVVHKKLANFMAPNEASDWTESSKSELYKSLFV